MEMYKIRKTKKLILACAAGDGTLMYLIQEAVERGCKVDDFIVCVVAYGTGNDLSLTLGWGMTPKYQWTKYLKQLTKEILEG